MLRIQEKIMLVTLMAMAGLAFGDVTNVPLDGLVAWFDASTITGVSNGQQVHLWPKKGGAAGVNDLVDWNSTDAYAPVYQNTHVDFNSRPCLYFSDQVLNNDYLVSSNMVSGYLSGHSVTVFFVSKSPRLGVLNFSSPRLYCLGSQLIFGSDPVGSLYVGNTNVTAIRAYTVDIEKLCAQGWVNGVLEGMLDLNGHPAGDFNYGAARGMRIGAPSVGTDYAGYMAEVLIYNRALTPVEMNEVGYYLQQKYGIQGAYKAPAKVLYINDITNIYTCESPFQATNAALTDEKIRESVDEVAGKVDVHMMECYGWIPWWISTNYSGKAHYERWQANHPQLTVSTFGKYMMQEDPANSCGDMMATFVDECRQTGQSPFISFRLNDHHHLDCWDPAKINAAGSEWISDFLWDNSDYRIGDVGDEMGLNWAYGHVWSNKLAMIAEICQNYDIDGLELDFLRSEFYFKTNETTLAQREAIMSNFVASVREILDETGRVAEKGHRWLCVRIPCLMSRYSPLGINIDKFKAAGVDMFNISSTVYTTQQGTDLPVIRAALPRQKVYNEMTQSIWNPAGFDSVLFTNFDGNATDEQLNTAAMLAYHYGADGISLFNFAYYRGSSASVEPYSEPPFHVIPGLADSSNLLQKTTHWYTRAKNYGNPWMPYFTALRSENTVYLDVIKTEQISSGQCLLRLIFAKDVCPEEWSVQINQVTLTPTYPILKPIPDNYQTPLGRSSQYLCYTVPIEDIVDGRNSIKLKQLVPPVSGVTDVVYRVDLVISPNLYDDLSLKAWYSADSLALSNGDILYQWSNSWGQAAGWETCAGAPRYDTNSAGFGGRPSIDIDGVMRGDLLESPSLVSDFLDNQELTVFTVTKGRYLGLHNSGVPRLYMRGFYFTVGDPAVSLSMPDSSSDTSVKIYRLSANPANESQAVMTGWINHVMQGTALTEFQNFGGTGDLYMPYVSGGTGSVAEIIIYNKALSDEQINAVGYYLANKYKLNTGRLAPTNTQYFNTADIPIVVGHN